jgi:hypothetical protein
MEATPVVGTPLLERTAETPVSVLDAPNLQTGQVRTLSDHGENLLQGALKRALVSQLEEDPRRYIGIQPRASGRFHNYRIVPFSDIICN